MKYCILFVLYLFSTVYLGLSRRPRYGTLSEGESTLMEVQFLFLDPIMESVVQELVHLHSLSLIIVPYTVHSAHPVNEQSVLPGPLDHLKSNLRLNRSVNGLSNGLTYQDAAELHIVEIVQQFEHLVRP